MPEEKKFTEADCKKAKCPEGAPRADFYDTQVPGLHLRVSKRGKKTWHFYYRYGGKQRREGLGRYPDPKVPLDELADDAFRLPAARLLANDIRLTVAAGKDPRTVQEEEEKEAARLEGGTVGNLFDTWHETFVKNHNTAGVARDTKSYFDRFVLPELGKEQVADITKRDVAELLGKVLKKRKDHAQAANHVHKHVRRFLGWCVRQGYIEHSPALGLGLPTPEPARERVLTTEELRAIWKATHELGEPFGPWVRLLMLTGQRRSEAANAERDHLDLLAKAWTIPAELSKSGRTHTIPLAPAAVALLRGMKKHKHGPYVFSTRAGKVPVSGFSKAKARLDRLCGVEDWRIHDLRRTCATNLARLGTPPQVVAAILNHSAASTMGVTAVYNRHDYAPEMREALEAWADWIAQHVASSKVVPFAKSRQARQTCGNCSFDLTNLGLTSRVGTGQR